MSAPVLAAALLMQPSARAATADAATCAEIERRYDSQKADLQAPQVSALLVLGGGQRLRRRGGASHRRAAPRWRRETDSAARRSPMRRTAAMPR